MLIIGHRGARGLKPENTIASIRAGLEAGIDIVEFDVRLTKDKIPVLSHDFHMLRTHRSPRLISQYTLHELLTHTAGSGKPIVTLDAALKECSGKVLVNIELKRSNAVPCSLTVVQKYIKQPGDWELFVFSSFSPAVLSRLRKLAPYAQLALLHRLNPFLFLRHMRKLQLVAVGFHRLYINSLALGIANKLDLFTYAYTVNRPDAALRLAEKGVDGVVTDRPDILIKTRGIKEK